MEEAGDKLSAEKDSEKKSPQHQRGDKRRRSSSSPDRSQVKRSRSPIPIKEDEPVIDSDKVQLSWCKYGNENKIKFAGLFCLNHKILNAFFAVDSDLHLQVDKESFLSGKPYHEGGFGYAWAGVRATHGVGTGKVQLHYIIAVLEVVHCTLCRRVLR